MELPIHGIPTIPTKWQPSEANRIGASSGSVMLTDDPSYWRTMMFFYQNRIQKKANQRILVDSHVTRCLESMHDYRLFFRSFLSQCDDVILMNFTTITTIAKLVGGLNPSEKYESQR